MSVGAVDGIESDLLFSVLPLPVTEAGTMCSFEIDRNIKIIANARTTASDKPQAILFLSLTDLNSGAGF